MQTSPSAELTRVRREYLAALMARDSHHARAVVERALAAGADPREVAVEVLGGALRDFGEGWEAGEVSVAHEHYATGITEGVLAVLAARMRRAPAGGRLAVIACPAGERHGIAARMLGDFLESEGWEVLVVGPDVPPRDLLELVADEQPDAVCLSVTLPTNLEPAVELLGALGTVEPRPFLAVGGQAWDGTARIAEAVGADVAGADLRGLVDVLRKRLPPLPEEDLEDVP